jgi:alpha-beta hydrolase superfamily lysophospholipase
LGFIYDDSGANKIMPEDPLPATKEDPSSLAFQSNDGLSLFGRVWLPGDAPIASLALVHGLGEHSGRYDHVANFFRQRNYAVFAVDLRGHGRSAGPRGHIEQFQDYLDDVKTLVTYIQDQSADVPLFLLGHSMGGLIALAYALTYPDDITTVIVSSPALRSRVEVPPWKAALAAVMSTLSPTIAMANGLDPFTLSQDETVVKAYQADPLVHDRVTARWFSEFTKAGEWAMAEANRLAVPTLILQGGADQIVDPAGSREFFDRIGLEDKYYIEYEPLYHEIFNEPEHLSVLGDVEAWLVPRLQPHVGALLIA